MYKIKELRKQNSITAKKLGEAVNVAESTISLYESGKRSPDYATLIKIADYFNVSLDYLLGRETEKTEQPTEYGELSAEKKALIDFALGVPEEKAKQVLRVLKAIVESDE